MIKRTTIQTKKRRKFRWKLSRDYLWNKTESKYILIDTRKIIENSDENNKNKFDSKRILKQNTKALFSRV